MRTSVIALVLTCGFGLISCARRDEPARRDDPSAREAGREAYDASREIKQGAKTAARELRDAGKEFQQGWRERQRESKDPEPPPEPKKHPVRRRD